MGAYEQVKKLCDRNGIAVTQLEKELGFGRGSIGKMRKSRPSGERLQKIADYFGVSVDYFLYNEMNTSADADQTSAQPAYYNDPETVKVAQAVFSDPNLRLLFDAAEDCSPDQVLLAAEMLKKFKEGR